MAGGVYMVPSLLFLEFLLVVSLFLALDFWFALFPLPVHVSKLWFMSSLATFTGVVPQIVKHTVGRNVKRRLSRPTTKGTATRSNDHALPSTPNNEAMAALEVVLFFHGRTAHGSWNAT
jgi:hypothetical protein